MAKFSASWRRTRTSPVLPSPPRPPGSAWHRPGHNPEELLWSKHESQIQAELEEARTASAAAERARQAELEYRNNLLYAVPRAYDLGWEGPDFDPASWAGGPPPSEEEQAAAFLQVVQ